MRKIQLYDVENHVYPNFKLNTSFRANQLFQCGICGARTNLVKRRSDLNIGVEAICPNYGTGWHENPAHPNKIIEDIKGNPDMKNIYMFF